MESVGGRRGRLMRRVVWRCFVQHVWSQISVCSDLVYFLTWSSFSDFVYIFIENIQKVALVSDFDLHLDGFQQPRQSFYKYSI